MGVQYNMRLGLLVFLSFGPLVGLILVVKLVLLQEAL